MAKDIRVDLQVGSKVYRKLLFRRAMKIVQGHHQAEYKAYLHLTRRIARDNLLASFFAEHLGMAYCPSPRVWYSTQILLDCAAKAYKAGKLTQAVNGFKQAVNHRNQVHNQWVKYQNRLSKGANRAKTAIKVYCTILSIAAGGYAKTIVGGAALAGGMSAGETGATQLGLYAQGVEKKIDIWKVVTDAGAAFLTSLLFGKLGSAFIGKLNQRLAGGKLFRMNAKAYKEYLEFAKLNKTLVPKITKSSAFWINFFKGRGEGILKSAITTAVEDVRGKKVTMNNFLDYIINRLPAKAVWGHVKGHWDPGVK